MLLVEKVQELQAIRPPLDQTEINRRIAEWKKQSNYKAPEPVEVKTQGAAETTSGSVAPTTSPPQKNPFSNSLYSNGQSSYFNDNFFVNAYNELAKNNNALETIDPEETEEQAAAFDAMEDNIYEPQELDPVYLPTVYKNLNINNMVNALGFNVYADTSNSVELENLQKSFGIFADEKNTTTLQQQIDLGNIKETSETGVNKFLTGTKERDENQNLFYNPGFFGKLGAGVSSLFYNYRGASLDDISGLSLQATNGRPVLALNYENGIKVDGFPEPLTQAEIKAKIKELQREFVTPDSAKELDNLRKALTENGGDNLMLYNVDQAQSILLNNKIDESLGEFDQEEYSKKADRILSLGENHLGNFEKRVFKAQRKIEKGEFENEEQKEILQYFIDNGEFPKGKSYNFDTDKFIDIPETVGYEVVSTKTVADVMGLNRDLGNDLYDKEGNLIQFDMQVPSNDESVYSVALDKAETTEVDVLRNEYVRTHQGIIELAKGTLELNNSKIEASEVPYDPMVNRDVRIENIKESMLSQDEIDYLNYIVKNGELPKDLKFLEGSTTIKKKFNTKLREYQVLNTALVINKNILTSKDKEYIPEFINAIADNKVFTLNEAQTLQGNLFKQVGLSEYSSGWGEFNYNLGTYDKNIGQNIFAGIPHLAQWGFEIAVFRRLSGNSVNTLFTGLNKISQAYFKGNKYMAAGARWALKGGEEAIEFGGAAALKQLITGKDQDIKGSVAAGLSMGFGGAAGRDGIKYFQRYLRPQFAKTPIYYLQDTPVWRNFTKNAASAAGGATAYISGGMLMDPLNYEYEKTLETFVTEFGKMYALRGLTTALKSPTGSMRQLVRDWSNTILQMKDLSYNSKKALGVLGIDESVVRDPKTNSNQQVAKTAQDAVNKVNEDLANDNITAEEAVNKLKQISESKLALDNQIAVNQAKRQLEKDRKTGQAPTRAEEVRTLDKLKNGEDLTALDSSTMSKLPPELIAQALSIELNSETRSQLNRLIDREIRIQKILNGGNGIIMTSQGEEYVSEGQYKISNKNPELRNEVYEYLNKKYSIDAEITDLEGIDKSQLSTLEREKLEEQIKAKLDELSLYKKGGIYEEDIQNKLQADFDSRFDAEKADAENVEFNTSRGKSRAKFVDNDNFERILQEEGIQGGERSIAITLRDGTRLINEDLARQVRKLSDATHEEVGHATLLDVFKDSEGKVTSDGIAVIESILAQLSPTNRRLLQEEVETRYNTRQDKALWYEENIAVLSEMIKDEIIKFNPKLGSKLLGIIPLYKKLGFENLNLETGEGLFELIRGLSDSGKTRVKAREARDTETERVATKRTEEQVEQDIKDQEEVDMGLETEVDLGSVRSKKTNLTPSSLTKITTPEIVAENTRLSEELKKAREEDDTQKEADIKNDLFLNNEAIVTEFVKAKFVPGLGISREDFRSGVVEEVLVRLNKTYKPESGEYGAYIREALFGGGKFGGGRLGNILKSLGQEGELFDKQVDEQKQAEVPVEETVTETVTEKEVKTPTQTEKFVPARLTPEFRESITIKEGQTESQAIQDKITDVITEAYKDKGPLRNYKDLGKTPKAIAQLYADMFGIKTVDALIEKNRNVPKLDNSALVKMRQFLVDNAASDFARLPRSKDDMGRATGILQTTLGKALYNKDGKLVGTLKNYLDIIKGKNVTINGIEFNKIVNGKQLPLYRDAQHYKAAIQSHINNRILEAVVGQKGERVRLGVNFSRKKKKPLTTEELKSTEYEGVALKNTDLVFKDKAGVEKKRRIVDTETPEYKSYVETYKDFFEASPSAKAFFRTGMTGGKRFVFNTVGNFEKTFGESPKAAVKRIKYSAGKEFSVAKFNKLLRSGDLKTHNKKAIKALEDLFVDIQDFLASPKGRGKTAAMEQFLRESAKDMNHPLRFLAPIAFYPINPKTGKLDRTKIIEEHMAPVVKIGQILFAAAKKGIVKETMPLIRQTFAQGGLRELDDTNLPEALKKDLPPEYYDKVVPLIREGKLDFLPEGLGSVIRYTLNNSIDPFSYALVSTGKSIGEFFVGPSKKTTTKAQAAENAQITNKLITEVLTGEITREQAKKQYKEQENLIDPKAKEAVINNELAEVVSFSKAKGSQDVIDNLAKADEAIFVARKLNNPVKKIRIFDFDDTLAKSKSMVVVKMPDPIVDTDMLDIAARRKFKKLFENRPSFKQNFKDLTDAQKEQVLKDFPTGKTFKINATEFAKKAAELEAEGAEFDFSEFSKVIDGKKGPLFNVAKKIADARGTEDLFILTARPQEAAVPIKEFMKALGIDIPLSNITGLADGKPQAKARWVVDKASLGYNDFYFADDAFKNVQAVKKVLDQIDVKSKVQQAKFSKAKTFNTIVQDMIFDSAGIEQYKTYSAAKAKTIGASKGKYNFLISAGAEDFTGLLYKMLGKGKKGDAQMAFLKTNLLDTYQKSEQQVIAAQVSAANDFVALKKRLGTLPKTLNTQTGIGKFSYQHAVRVAVWNKQGMNIPGLSKRDTKQLLDFVKNNPKLATLANELVSIQKGKLYPKPGESWLGGNITTDIIGGINKNNRAEYQQEFRENVDIIFSKENLNKMEAAYGSNWRRALEDSLRRMKAGTNRPMGGNPTTDALLDWLNNAVGNTMFLNTRSALLQTISSVNYLNWSDNNIVQAGKAFANQKQYWSDFMTLMNSDYLVQRRNGLKINVSESEIADAVKDAKNKPSAAISYLLNKGFVFTRYADSFAIAAGGATFYRNRLNRLIKEGMDPKLAEEQAFADFRAVSEESQQSSSPDKISMQQASGAGRVILAWANTPMQYARIQKRAAQDLINGRGDWKTNVSKIVYYGVVQNLIFNSLQQAAFAMGFGDDDEVDDAQNLSKKERIYRIGNGMVDSQLKGLGVFGAGTVAVKNALMTIAEENNKKSPEFAKAIDDLIGFSPPLNAKIRALRSGLNTFSWNRKEIKEKGFSLDNPAYLAGSQVISSTTNIPLDRLMKKINNLRGVMSEKSELWQKVALTLGYSTWDLGLGYYGGFDKPKPLTPTQQYNFNVDKMKKDTSSKQQKETLLELGLTKKQIKALRYEDARVKKIIELQNKNKEK